MSSSAAASSSSAAAGAASTSYDYLVLGAGSAGLATARRAASYGFRSALIEHGRVGGTCVNVGCVPKKLMWSAASMYEMIAHQSKEYGMEFAHAAKHTEEKADAHANGIGLEFNWKMFRDRREAYIQRLNTIYDSSLKKEKVDYIVGNGKFLSANSIEVTAPDGQRTVYTAKHICIATGGHAIVPKVHGAEFGMTSDGFFELQHMPKVVAVVGGGYIAVELAGIFRALGAEVHLFIRYDRFLRTFDHILSDGLADEMKNAGLHIHRYSAVESLEKLHDGKVKLHASVSKVAPKEFSSSLSSLPAFESVLWAVGRAPNVHGIGLENIGVKLNSAGYIIADEFENTSVENIYAIGDVTGKAELTPVAIAAGRKLSDRLFDNRKGSKLDYQNIPTVVFSHPPLGTIGLTEQEAVDQYGVDNVLIYKTSFRNLYFGPLEKKQMTHMKLVCIKPNEQVVGLHVMGMGADEMLQGFGVAIKMGATKKDIDSVVAIHPTAAEEFVTMKTSSPPTAKPSKL